MVGRYFTYVTAEARVMNRQVGNSDQCHRCTIRDIVTIVIITTNSMIMTTATPTTTRKAIPA
ncbi:MAG: hypothetical protein KGZ49_03765 [Syntrophaceae bacterium]|nr:hypothetical protein [Syntrophaceae bacterium]